MQELLVYSLLIIPLIIGAVYFYKKKKNKKQDTPVVVIPDVVPVPDNTEYIPDVPEFKKFEVIDVEYDN